MKYNIKLYLLLLFLISLSISSCSNDAKNSNDNNKSKYIRNSLTPFYKKVDLKLKKLYTINGDSDNLDSIQTFLEPFFFNFDSDSNFYIGDFKSRSIKKYNKNGAFITSIGRQGQGPGEFKDISKILISNDTLYVYEFAKRINKFNLNGEFLYRKTYDKQNFTISKINALTDSTLIGYKFIVDVDKKEGEAYFILKTSVLDYDINELNTILETKISYKDFLKDKSNLKKKEHLITCDMKETVYITTNSKDKYEINSYNLKEDSKLRFTKNYRKIRFNTETKKELKEVNKKSNMSKKDFKDVFDYKPAIFRIFTDKYNNLWVNTFLQNLHNRFEFDIFNRKGVFIGNYVIDLNLDQFMEYSAFNELGFFFEKDFLIIIDYKILAVNVYDYEIEFN